MPYAELAGRARARAPSAVEGLYGPQSVTWRVDRELAILLGGGRALLLQLAHPAVAAGVAEHSDFFKDPVGRTFRTFDAVYRVVFADLEGALARASRVYATHARVQGEVAPETSSPAAGRPYHANDPALLFWVMATLLDTSLACYQRFVAPLSSDELERFYQESMTGCLAYGIPERHVPSSFAAFERYMRETLEGPLLHVGATGRRLWQSISRQPLGDLLPGLLGGVGVPARLSRLLDVGPVRGRLLTTSLLLTAGLLPERLRDAYGLRFDAQDARRFEQIVGLVRPMLPRLPPRLRYSPYYLEAADRIERARRVA